MLRLLISGAKFESGIAQIGLTLLRVATGLGMALGHGINKVPPSEGFVTSVENLGFPAPVLFAWAAGLSELAGGVLLALGLLTRPAALSVAFTMAIAFFLVHANDPFQAKEMAFLYGFATITFLFVGSGRYGVDHLLRR